MKLAASISVFVCACDGAAVSAGPTNTPSSPHQGIEIGAHKDIVSKPLPSPDEDRPVEPTQPLGASSEEQALAHVHHSGKTCSGVLVGPRLVFTSRRCTGDGVGARGHEGDLRVQIPSGRLAWAHRKVEAWVAPSCNRESFDIALLVLDGAVETKPLQISSVPDIGGKLRSPGYGSCGGSTAGIRTGPVIVRGASTLSVEAALCASDMGAPLIDQAGNAVGLVIRAGHDAADGSHEDPDHMPRHTAVAVRLDTAPPRALLARARRVLDGDATAVDAITPCE